MREVQQVLDCPPCSSWPAKNGIILLFFGKKKPWQKSCCINVKSVGVVLMDHNLALVLLNCNPLSGVSCTWCRRRTCPASSRRSAWSKRTRTPCGTPRGRSRCTLFSAISENSPLYRCSSLMLIMPMHFCVVKLPCSTFVQ